jgi:hypothetical protein
MSAQAPRRDPVAALVVLAAGALVALALWLGTLAIEREWIAGPNLQLRFGTYYILAQTTNRPECLPLPLQQCFFTLPIPNTPYSRYYVVWAGEIRHLTPAPDGLVTVSKGRRIIQLLITR